MNKKKAIYMMAIIILSVTSCIDPSSQRFADVNSKKNILESKKWYFKDFDQETYGYQNIKIPAQQKWVNTGLYVEKGDNIQIKNTGKWTFYGNKYTAEGDIRKNLGKCHFASLQATIGMNDIICVNNQKTIYSGQEGVLYVTANIEEESDRASGSESIKSEIISDSSKKNIVRSIYYKEVDAIDIKTIRSLVVEVLSNSVILSLPLEYFRSQSYKLKNTIEYINNIYDTIKELKAIAAQDGQPIRLIFDDTVASMAEINPCTLEKTLIQKNHPNNISDIYLENSSAWIPVAKCISKVFTLDEKNIMTKTFSQDGWTSLFSKFFGDSNDLIFYNAGNQNIPCSIVIEDAMSKKPAENMLELKNEENKSYCFLLDLVKKYSWNHMRKYFIYTRKKYIIEKNAFATSMEINKFKEDFEQANQTNIDDIFTHWNLK